MNPRPFDRSERLVSPTERRLSSELLLRTPLNSSATLVISHQKGHIASSPKCPNFQQRQNHPRFNAQHVIDGEDDPDEEDNEDADQENDEYANSWGGSQYDPKEEEHDDEQLEYLETEDTPEGEGPKGPEEVRLSSMRTTQMFAMRTNAVDDTSSESTDEEPTSLSSILATTNSTRIEPPIPDIEDIIPENHRSTSGDIMPQDDPESEDREEITDPVF